MPPKTHLRDPYIRKKLAHDLPGLPEEMALKEDTYILTLLAAVWLDTDDRSEQQSDAHPV